MEKDLQDPRIIEGLKAFPKHAQKEIVELISSYPKSFFKPKSTFIDSNNRQRVNMTWDMDALEEMNEFKDVWYVPWENIFCIPRTGGQIQPWIDIPNSEKVGFLSNILSSRKRGKPGMPGSWYKINKYFFIRGSLNKWHYPTYKPLYSPHIVYYLKTKSP